MTASDTLKIERKIFIRSPRSRVWRAITASEEFAKWFSAGVKGPFEPGKCMELVSTHPASKAKGFYFIVERMEPEHTFSWRWHPGSARADEDGATLVEFHLEETPEGTIVTVTETGFDRISLARRAKAFEENGRGWEMQMNALKQYVGESS
jgi:uncharacterized protein YndB with AHSA1/START domain